MPYIVNTNTYNFSHPKIGVVPPRTAIEVDYKMLVELKNHKGIKSFDTIIKKERKAFQPQKSFKELLQEE